jgi:hypothetical protein
VCCRVATAKSFSSEKLSEAVRCFCKEGRILHTTLIKRWNEAVRQWGISIDLDKDYNNDNRKHADVGQIEWFNTWKSPIGAP